MEFVFRRSTFGGVPKQPSRPMDLYISSMVLGAIGFTIMALGGLGSRGSHHAGAAGRAGGHTPGLTHAHSHSGGTARPSHGLPGTNIAGRAFWLVTSPRFLFSLMLGFGATGAML